MYICTVCTYIEGMYVYGTPLRDEFTATMTCVSGGGGGGSNIAHIWLNPIWLYRQNWQTRFPYYLFCAFLVGHLLYQIKNRLDQCLY